MPLLLYVDALNDVGMSRHFFKLRRYILFELSGGVELPYWSVKTIRTFANSFSGFPPLSLSV